MAGSKRKKKKKQNQKREIWQKPGFDPKAGFGNFNPNQLKQSFKTPLLKRKVIP